MAPALYLGLYQTFAIFFRNLRRILGRFFSEIWAKEGEISKKFASALPALCLSHTRARRQSIIYIL